MTMILEYLIYCMNELFLRWFNDESFGGYPLPIDNKLELTSDNLVWFKSEYI